MAYSDIDTIEITRHNKGVTISLDPRAYAAFVEAIGNLHAEREDAVTTAMVEKIKALA